MVPILVNEPGFLVGARFFADRSLRDSLCKKGSRKLVGAKIDGNARDVSPKSREEPGKEPPKSVGFQNVAGAIDSSPKNNTALLSPWDRTR